MSAAILALEDGFVLRGRAFGARSQALGEVCFNTSMSGYQEVLTDPSYRGQIVSMTYTEIGNYGICPEDNESDRPQVSGFVVRELSPVASNWRSTQSLEDFLIAHGIPGICEVDTRALTSHLRTRGALRGVITTEEVTDAAAVDLAKSASYEGIDFVEQVSTPQAYDWDTEEMESREWTLGGRKPLPPATMKIVAFDFGIKRNILRSLRQRGFQVRVVPARTSAEEVLALKPDGVFLSNGPGDPSVLDYAHKTVRGLIGKQPIFGICLGHQILGYAMGGSTYKLKFGHRGGNQPVKDLMTGKVTITSQNHGFAVDTQSVPNGEVEVTHSNLNDGTCEGMRHKGESVFSVQYHPEAAPGPHDADYFFDLFAKRVAEFKGF